MARCAKHHTRMLFWSLLQETTWRVRQEPRQVFVPGMASSYLDSLAKLEHARWQLEAPQR